MGGGEPSARVEVANTMPQCNAARRCRRPTSAASLQLSRSSAQRSAYLRSRNRTCTNQNQCVRLPLRTGYTRVFVRVCVCVCACGTGGGDTWWGSPSSSAEHPTAPATPATRAKRSVARQCHSIARTSVWSTPRRPSERYAKPQRVLAFGACCELHATLYGACCVPRGHDGTWHGACCEQRAGRPD